MLNESEKAELKQIINKFVEQGRCFRPLHPDDVMLQIKGSESTEACGAERVEWADAAPASPPIYVSPFPSNMAEDASLNPA
jgi:hypothetical protein